MRKIVLDANCRNKALLLLFILPFLLTWCGNNSGDGTETGQIQTEQTQTPMDDECVAPTVDFEPT